MNDLQVDALLQKFDTLITLLTNALMFADPENAALMKKATQANLEQQFTKEVIDGWKADIAAQAAAKTTP
jgi:hypothetical protein